MNIRRLTTALVLAAGAATVASAQQDIKLSAVLEAWYTQMLNSNLRLDSAPSVAPYYANGAMNAAFKENTFYLRRTEIYLNGKVGDQVTWGAMFDPNTSSTASSSASSNLLDLWMAYAFNSQMSAKIGQFKMPSNYESTIYTGSKLLFYDRSMTARMWAEKRDRGVLATYSTGDPNGLSWKVNVGVSNGMADSSSTYKANDTNAQKDWAFALQGAYGKYHNFELWYREGVTDLKNSGLVAGTFAGTTNVPATAQVLANKDKTTSLGAFYVYDSDRWHGDVEISTGLLGRRYPSIFAAGTATPVAANRQYLDQKYLGYTLSGAYKMGRHWFTARFDHLDFNEGGNWYTATNPYTSDVTTGLPTGNDYTPTYYEAIVGYNYLFNPSKYVDGKIKFDYIHRSSNFLAPRAGQVGEQGGDSLVMSVQIGF